ncbi:hypothetical protein [Azospirillum doebereinerae]
MMVLLWSLIATSALAVGLLGERYLRIHANRLSEKLTALVERLDVYANYGKLAALRRIESEETVAKLREQVAAAEAEVKAMQADADSNDGTAPMVFHCADRVPRSEGPLWYVAVEAKDGTAPWTGVKHYALVADTPDEARKRIQERHPSPAGFAIGPALPLILPDR